MAELGRRRIERLKMRKNIDPNLDTDRWKRFRNSVST